MPRLDRLWYEIDAQTKGFDEGILQSKNKLASFAEYAAGHPVAVLGALGVAATLAGAKMAAMAADFEKQMAQVSTVLDPATADIHQLAIAVTELNAALPIENIKELTKGLYDIISSGIPAGQAVEFLTTASKAAIGGLTDVATTVDGLTTAVNAFRSQGLDVTRASDVMFQTVNKGKIRFDELSHSMALGASISAGLGIKFEDLNAAVAQLSLGGMDARMAMVGIRSALVNIMKPQEDFIKSFPEIAAEFNRAKLAAVGLTGFLTELSVASKGNREVFVKLFNDVQGLNAVMALTATDGGAALKTMLGDIQNSVGATEAAAAKMGATTSATAQVLKNQFGNLMRDLGADLLPAVNLGLETMNYWLGKIGSAGERNRIKDIVVDLRSLSFTQDKPGFTFFGSDFTKTQGSFREFIEDVRQGRVELASLSRTELAEVRDGMIKMNSVLPDWPGYQDALNQVTAAMQQHDNATKKAAESQAKADKAVTEGAVAFTESTAKSVASLTKNVDALGRGETAAKNYEINMRKLTEANREAQAAMEAAKKAQESGNRAQAEQAQKDAGEALGKATAARQEAREALKQMNDAKRAEDAERKRKLEELAQQERARRELQFELRDALAKTTGTAVDDLGIQLAKQVAEFRAKLAQVKGLSPEERALQEKQISDIERMNEQTIKLLQNTEKVEATQRRVDKATLGLLTDTENVDLYRGISAEIDRLKESLRGVDEGSAEFKSTSEDILKLEQARERLWRYLTGLMDKAVSAAEREEAARERSRRHTERMIRDVQQLGQGALALANAFGLINDETADTLNNVINIAANLPKALKGDLGSIGSILGSLAKMFKSGEDPEVKRARIQNTEALKALTEKIGDLSKLAISGESLVRARKYAEAFRKEVLALQDKMKGVPGYGNLSGMKLDFNKEPWASLLKAAGITAAEFTKIANDLGFQIKTVGDMYKILEALNMADLAAYTDDYVGAMARLQDTFRAYDITDPAERLRRTIEFLGSDVGIPAIADALKGVDVSTAAGASEAITRLQSLFEMLAEGSITAAQLGGASVDETRQMILDLIEQLRGGSGGATGSMGYTSQITEATGSHIAGMLAAANTFAARTADATEGILRILGTMTGLSSISAPGLPAGLGGAQFTININVNGVADPVTAKRVGEEVGRATIDTINQGLASRLRQVQRAFGNRVVS